MGDYNVQEKVNNQKKSSNNQDVGAVQLKQNNMADIIQRAKINPNIMTQNDAMVLQRKIGNGGLMQFFKQQGKMQEDTMKENHEKLEEQGPLQMKKNDTIQRAEMPENKTGMPDNLKAGVEKLSGLDMSDVRVHYNSDKPAKVGALAYTQGTEINVGPGQEKHLAHEAWHVVQQKQGRVHATTQMKGMQVNDDVGLEREADLMGNKVILKKSNNLEKNSKNAFQKRRGVKVFQMAIYGKSHKRKKKKQKRSSIAIAVDQANMGHTYIILEIEGNIRMFHFRAEAEGMEKVAKLISWTGNFKEINIENNGRTADDFIRTRTVGMSFNKIKASKTKVENVLSTCENMASVGSERFSFSLILSNIRIGNNCFSKVYRILTNAGFKFSWSTYLLSFISPRLALRYGDGFQDDKKKSEFHQSPPHPRLMKKYKNANG